MRVLLVIFNLFVLVLPAVVIGVMLSLVGNPSDAARLAGLSLVGSVLVYFAILRHSKLLWCFSALWWLIFLTDTVLRTAAWYWLHSDLDAYFIVQAIANTNFKESVEFVQSHLLYLTIAALLIILLVMAYLIFIKLYLKTKQLKQFRQQPITLGLVIFLGIAMTASYAMRPSRALFPALYWSDYYAKIQDFKSSIAQHTQLRQTWAHKAKQDLRYDTNFQQKQTHVLAISESITSLNLGVCGYSRQTTPEIAKRLQDIQVFCNAYSPYASTINAITANLTSTSARHPAQPDENLLSYAREAGFKIYWISNQDDRYISSLFGSDADTALYLNKRAGRSSHQLDENILPAYLKALADPYPRKLVILHLIGAHPNYESRYPLKFEHFNAASDDQVEQEMDKKDIGLWVQNKRNAYDNAVLYQDWLYGQLFDAIQAHPEEGYRSLTFISDHGNEVGHELNYAGHSPSTKAGYQVPIIMWHDHMQATGVDKNRTIDASQLDLNMMHLMGLHDKSDPSDQTKSFDWLNPHYQFVPNSSWPYWQKEKSAL